MTFPMNVQDNPTVGMAKQVRINTCNKWTEQSDKFVYIVNVQDNPMVGIAKQIRVENECTE